MVGNFPAKSVGILDTEKDSFEATRETEKDVEFRTVALNSIGGKTFVPVHEMEQMINPLNVATDISSNWDEVD